MIHQLFCRHKYKIIDEFQPYSNVKLLVLNCPKCGKVKKVKSQSVPVDF